MTAPVTEMSRVVLSSAYGRTAGARPTTLTVSHAKLRSSCAGKVVAFSPSVTKRQTYNTGSIGGPLSARTVPISRVFRNRDSSVPKCNPKGFGASTGDNSSETKSETNADEVLEQLSNGMVPGAEMIVSLLEKAYAEESLGEEAWHKLSRLCNGVKGMGPTVALRLLFWLALGLRLMYGIIRYRYE